APPQGRSLAAIRAAQRGTVGGRPSRRDPRCARVYLLLSGDRRQPCAAGVWMSTTHIVPPSTVRRAGVPLASIVVRTRAPRGSIFATESSPLFATHTDPAPTATSVGWSPTATVSIPP